MRWFWLMLLTILPGCTVLPDSAPARVNRPSWIDHPETGVSASAAFHVHGRAAQEELAITRAREELAKRQGVTVDSESLTRQRVEAGLQRTTAEKQISETVSGATVKSSVKAKWLEPETGVLWVWVIPD